MFKSFLLERNLKMKPRHLTEMPNSDCLVIKINIQKQHKPDILTTCWLPAEASSEAAAEENSI